LTKKKLQRFEESKTFKHFLQPTYEDIADGFYLKGCWNQKLFKNNNPVTLELGCGKGEYTVALARKYPHRNFVGVDRKGARIWRGAKTVEEERLPNAGFLRIPIDMITQYFGKNEVDELWITFPDPQPQKNRMRKRLTSPMFLRRYNLIMKPGGLIHLKTDDRVLFDFTLEVIRKNNLKLDYATTNLYESDFEGDVKPVRTYYEKKFLEVGKQINYIKFRLTDEEWLKEDGTGQEYTFFQRVFDVVKRIPYGRVTSYGAIAKYLGSAGSARMVGWAMNASHSSSEPVPAHRVVNRIGMLTGKHHFGSHELMQQLLENENIKVENDKIVEFEKHFWNPLNELI